MVLDYIDTSPLPNQTELAIEMHTTENQTAQWKYTYLPFEKRGFNDYFNGSLPNNFETALNLLKGNVSRNYPTIVDTWFDEQAKENNTITHARVIIGYNTTGVFFHDPWSGPNQFMNNQEFEDLWNTTEGYYVFMLEQEPLFNLTAKTADWLGNPVPDLNITLILNNEVNQTSVTDHKGIARIL